MSYEIKVKERGNKSTFNYLKKLTYIKLELCIIL